MPAPAAAVYDAPGASPGGVTQLSRRVLGSRRDEEIFYVFRYVFLLVHISGAY